MRSALTLVVFVAGVLACGITIGVTFTPGAWYAGLEKPPFNPPNWIFAPVWTVLYILIGVAGWRTWMRDRHGPAMQLWTVQMGLNFLWSPVFFGAHLMAPGLAIILLMLMAVTGFIRRARESDRLAALLFLPYWIWVAFAAMLNAALLYLNALSPGT